MGDNLWNEWFLLNMMATIVLKHSIKSLKSIFQRWKEFMVKKAILQIIVYLYDTYTDWVKDIHTCCLVVYSVFSLFKWFISKRPSRVLSHWKFILFFIVLCSPCGLFAWFVINCGHVLLRFMTWFHLSFWASNPKKLNALCIISLIVFFINFWKCDYWS